MRLLSLITLGLIANTAAADSSLQDRCFEVDGVANPEQAVLGCSSLIESGPIEQDVLLRALHLRGIAKRQSGDMAGSIADFESILAVTPDDTGTLRMLAWTYREQGAEEKAETIYTDVLKQDDHWQGWLSRCAVRTDLKKYYLAISDCSEVSERINLDTSADAELRVSVMQDAWFFTAFSYNQVNQPARAATIARQGLGHPDINGRLYFMTLVGLWNSDQLAEIDALLAEGFEKHPGDLDLVYFQSEWEAR